MADIHVHDLTPVEFAVVRRLATHGESNARLGFALGITEHTIKVHMKNVMRKLRVNTRCEIVIWAVRNGIAEPGSKDGDATDEPPFRLSRHIAQMIRKTDLNDDAAVDRLAVDIARLTRTTISNVIA